MLKLSAETRKNIQRITQQVDPNRYRDTLESLIRIPSLSGEELAFAQAVAERLESMGMDEVQVDECDNLVARLSGGPGHVLLNAHMDTMKPHPEMKDPYEPRAEMTEGEERIYGLGAASTKGSIASILEALEVLIACGEDVPSITFLGVGRDFHPTIHGIKDAFRLHKFDVDCAIVMEPTNLRVGVGARGYTHTEVTFKGKPHHAGRPNHQLNPIAGAAEFVHKALSQPLPDHPQLGSASLTVVEWSSEGQRPHTPASATVLIDRRLVPDDPPMEVLLDQWKKLASEFSEELNVDLTLKRHQYPWVVDHHEKIVTCLSESLRIVLDQEPTLYALPFSTAAGYIKEVGGITPVAFSGGDIANLGLQEHAVLSNSIKAAQSIVGTLLLYAAT